MDPIPYSDTQPMPDSRLTHAAVRVGDVVCLGWRHADIMHSITPRVYVDQDQQGFVDQHGSFYGRYQAARVAYHAGQIADIPPTLVSEMLWDGNGEPLPQPWPAIVRTFSLPTKRVKVGRNEQCPCGSRTKFKKCCGK